MRTLPIALAALALTAATAVPAASTLHVAGTVECHFTAGPTRVWLVVNCGSWYENAQVTGQVHVSVNGQSFKADLVPPSVSTSISYDVGPTNVPIQACATFDGAMVGPGDSENLFFTVEHCASYVPQPGFRFAGVGDPALGAPPAPPIVAPLRRVPVARR